MLGRPIDLGNPAGDHPLARGLVVWLHPLPNSWGGRQLGDLRGRTAAAFNSTGVTWAGPAGRPGGRNAIDLAGGASDNASVSYTWSFPGGTAAVWVYPKTSGSFGRAVDANHANGFWIGRNGTTSQFGGAFRSNNTSPFGAFATVANNAWSHITIARTGSVSTCYLNGVAASTFDAGSTVNSAGVTITLGRSAAGDIYTGRLDDFALWERTLSADEIWRWYDQSRRGHPDTLRRFARRARLAPAPAAPAAFDPAAGFPWPDRPQPDRTPPAAVPY